ncbi:MAG: AarF/ABC1/UbiB kinase family protein [Sandaracinaceae bacterium]|nr:AarF/ABC1/UbiB kinase family protein [Sandaracinaceae bacterium]
MRVLGLAARAVAIGLVVSAALFVYGIRRLSILDDQDAVDHLRGRVVRGAMSTLGATFIKLGQVMSTRPDLFPPGFIAELRLLQDELPPFSAGAARARIEEELGQPADAIFTELDEAPLAAASVAQVHRGRLRATGQEVAVKVLRPDVRHKTERDGAILMAFADLAMRLSEVARHADFAGHAAHFLEGVLAQTDLTVEAANYERFRANFAAVEGIRFPRVYPEASGRTVMTMDLVRGRKVDALRPEDDTPAIARRLRRAFLKMLFEDGFLHADLHPGNMLVDDRGDVAIFDVGLATALSDELLEYYIDFNKCLVLGTAPDFVEHLRRYHSYVEGRVDWDELARDVEDMVGAFRGKSASELEFGAMIERTFAVGRKYEVRPFPEMTLIMVGLVTAEGIGKQLAPELDSFSEVASYLMPILARRGMLPVGMPVLAG